MPASLSLSDVSLVGGGIHQILELRGIGDAQPDHPSLAVGIGVDESGIRIERAVGLDHLASHGSEELGDRLDRLDGAEGFHAAEGHAGLRKLDEDDIPQLALGIVGDADEENAILVGALEVLVLLVV